VNAVNTTSPAPTAPSATHTATPLTRLDRCDRCSAAAQIRALLPGGGELLFCGHHGQEHESRLRAFGAVLTN
jgi:hypothetical protein